LADLARKYGDVVRVRVGRSTGFLLNDPALIRFVLVERADAFTRGFITPAAERLVAGSLIAIEGEEHDRKKRAMAPLFGHERLEFIAKAATAWAEEAASSMVGARPVDIRRVVKDLSLRVTADNLFSMADPAELTALSAALESALGAFTRSLHPVGYLLDKLPLPGKTRVRDSTEALKGIVDKAVAERRAHPGHRGDVLDMLAQMPVEGAGPDRLTDAELRAEAIDLLTGSHGTLTFALSWTLYDLAQDGAAQEAVSTQTLEALGQRPARLAEMPALSAARSAFLEGLRLHPPAWAYLRRAREDVRLGPYLAPAGTYIVLCPYVTHRDPRYFDDPLTFDPSRWSGKARATRQSLAYFPFGAGPRGCIGEGIAMTQGTLVLATILRRVKLEPVPGSRALDSPIPVRPLGSLMVRAERRLGRPGE
jgi:cytochrome P450